MVVVNELPVDVLSKIVSYCIGQPEYVKLNHNKALRKIQNKQKIKYYKIKPFYIKDFNTMKKTNHFFIVYPSHRLDDILEQERKIQTIVIQEKNVIDFFVKISIEYFDKNGYEKIDSIQKSFKTWHSIDDILLVVYWFYAEMFNHLNLPERINYLAFDIDVYSRK